MNWRKHWWVSTDPMTSNPDGDDASSTSNNGDSLAFWDHVAKVRRWLTSNLILQCTGLIPSSVRQIKWRSYGCANGWAGGAKVKRRATTMASFPIFRRVRVAQWCQSCRSFRVRWPAWWQASWCLSTDNFRCTLMISLLLPVQLVHRRSVRRCSSPDRLLPSWPTLLCISISWSKFLYRSSHRRVVHCWCLINAMSKPYASENSSIRDANWCCLWGGPNVAIDSYLHDHGPIQTWRNYIDRGLKRNIWVRKSSISVYVGLETLGTTFEFCWFEEL